MAALAGAVVQAADVDTDMPLSMQAIKGAKVSPEATKVLPSQPEDRGELMPLHMNSVLEWLCGDSTVQQKLAVNKRGCYATVWPIATACTEALQERAPAAQNRVDTVRMDVVSFRAALRQCIGEKYEQKEAAAGRSTQSIQDGVPDPLAARMGAPPGKK